MKIFSFFFNHCNYEKRATIQKKSRLTISILTKPVYQLFKPIQQTQSTSTTQQPHHPPSLNSNSNNMEAVLDLPQKKIFTKKFLINGLRPRTENPQISLQKNNPIQQIQYNQNSNKTQIFHNHTNSFSQRGEAQPRREIVRGRRERERERGKGGRE